MQHSKHLHRILRCCVKFSWIQFFEISAICSLLLCQSSFLNAKTRSVCTAPYTLNTDAFIWCYSTDDIRLKLHLSQFFFFPASKLKVLSFIKGAVHSFLCTMTWFSISSSECSIVWTYWSTLSHHLSLQAESKPSFSSAIFQLFFFFFFW